MKRILDSIKFFFRIKFKKLALKKKVIIFDCVNTSDLISILNYNEIFIMSSRIERINTVYLSWNIILFMFKNIFKRRVKLNYFIALIEETKPDLVITTVDNSVEFSLLSKYFFGKIKFLAIQFATRNDVYKNEKGNNKKLFFSNLICFSQFDLDLLKANGITVKNHFFAGSFKNSFFQNFSHKFEDKKRYDICYVTKQMHPKGYSNYKEILANQIKNMEYLARYVLNKDIKLLIQSKREKNSLELNLYNQIFFKNNNVEISWRKSETDYLNSYRIISSSKIVIGTPSTLLREAMTYNAKVLCCEYLSFDKGSHPFSDYNYLEKSSYEQFKEKIDQLFQISVEEYFKKIKYSKDYYMKNSNLVQLVKNLVERKTSTLI